MKSNIPAVIAFVLVGLLVYFAIKLSRNRPRATFAPDLANDKEVFVQGWSEAELKRIITDFQKMYAGRLGAEFSMVFQNAAQRIHVRFPHDMPAEEFGFFVNYVQYPKGFDLKSRSIVVSAKATLARDFTVPEESLVGQNAFFYIPANDRDYDVVYVRVGDRTFENSFASSNWRVAADPRLPSGIDPSK